jgi:hypothetical protein
MLSAKTTSIILIQGCFCAYIGTQWLPARQIVHTLTGSSRRRKFGVAVKMSLCSKCP